MLKFLPLTSAFIVSSALYVLLAYNNVVKPLPLEAATPWIVGGIFMFVVESSIQDI